MANRKAPTKINRKKLKALMAENESMGAGYVARLYLDSLGKKADRPKRQSVYNLVRELRGDAFKSPVKKSKDKPYAPDAKTRAAMEEVPFVTAEGLLAARTVKEEDPHANDPIVINLRSRIAHYEHIVADLKNALRLVVKHK